MRRSTSAMGRHWGSFSFPFSDKSIPPTAGFTCKAQPVVLSLPQIKKLDLAMLRLAA